jgi:hypothetical protein
MPPVVDPGPAGPPVPAPSDAIVLFDGKGLSQWMTAKGEPAKWKVENGYMEVAKGTGEIRTRSRFGDCQLHVEWASPVEVAGTSQGRGNSGVFLMGIYEVQVLDCFENKTYADGMTASLYGQYPPLVNASFGPGEWQTYDIVYTAPRFDAAGKLLSPAYLTVFHNGLLIQNHAELTGPTSWLERAPYSAHPEKQPISLQDHGNPVRYRNVWVRELGRAGKKEFTLATKLLDSYAGTYGNIEVARDGRQLVAKVSGRTFLLFAESPGRFFAKTTDVQLEFKPDAEGKVNELIWSVGEGMNVAKRTR